MNSRKASISHVMNDSSAATSSSDHHLSSNSGHSLRNLLSDDGPTQQHASLQQQYPHSASNNSGLSNGVYATYPNDQGREYYSHVQQQQPQPVHNQPLSSLEQNNRQSFLNNDVSADADEASKTLILLSQRAPPPYGLSRDHYSSKDNGQQISDAELAASTISSLSHSPDDTKSIHPQINQKAKPKNSMAISSLISGDESTSSDPAQSMQVGPTSTDTMPRYYQQHHHDSYPDETRNGDIPSHHHPNHQHQTQNQQNMEYTPFNATNTGNSRKSTKRPLNVSPHLPINTKVYSKKSPQKRRPSDPNESPQRPKIHHRTPDQMPYPSSGQKFPELREHPSEEQKPSLYLPPSQVGPTNSTDWDHQMQQQQFHPPRSLPPADHRFQSKNCASPPMSGDKSMNIKPFIINPNERSLPKTSPPPPPTNAPNGYVHNVGVGGMVGNPDIPQASPHQPITQSIPQQNGQIRPPSSIPSNNANFCRMYNDMQKHNIKKKRNAMHAYISYMIYTTSLQDGKEYPLPNNNMIQNRVPDNSPLMNSEHGIVNPPMVHHHHHHPPQINGTGYTRLEHSGYPPLQPNNPGYIHPEPNPSNVQSRRVSDSTMHPQQSSLTRGYPPHGPPVAEPQPPHTSHRPPIGSHHNSPSLLPTHIQPPNHSIRQSMPNIHPNSQHQTPPSPLSRSGSVPRQQPTTLPPIQSSPSHSQPLHHHHHHHSSPHHVHHYSQDHQPHHSHTHHPHAQQGHHFHQPHSSQPSYISQPLPAQGPPSHLYNGKSSPVPPPLIPPQSPAMNHYHSSQQGLVSQQNGSRLPPVGSHHHNSQPPELVGPSNNDQHQIISRPLTSFLRDQPAGYGSAHPHNIQPNGLGPVGPPSHVGPPLSSGPRNGPNGYY